MSGEKILVVEDRDSLRRMLQLALENEGYRVEAAADGQGALAALSSPVDLVITDLQLPDITGLDVLRRAKELSPSLPVVVLTAFGSVGTAVEAMKLGAADFLEKPLELDQLFRLVRAHLLPPAVSPAGGASPAETTASPGDEARFPDVAGRPIVGRHPRLLEALRLLQRVAPTDTIVLLTGESGTGKELFARSLHAASGRRQGPFVAVNCAAIPESLIENELFGHEKGAFTGAVQRQRGRFEMAEGGTLFLDEIGELPLEVQGKILRVLEERVYERVGSGRSQKADVRVVAATNRDLQEMTARQTFRLDLYYRLNIFPIELPPLRERASDIPLLAEALLEQLATRLKVRRPTLTAEALDWLRQQPWPGNVRELSNVLERCLILGERSSLDRPELEGVVGKRSSAPPTPELAPDDSEREKVRAALRASGGDKTQAAAALGISYRTLLRRVRELDLEGYPKYRD